MFNIYLLGLITKPICSRLVQKAENFLHYYTMHECIDFEKAENEEEQEQKLYNKKKQLLPLLLLAKRIESLRFELNGKEENNNSNNEINDNEKLQNLDDMLKLMMFRDYNTAAYSEQGIQRIRKKHKPT